MALLFYEEFVRITAPKLGPMHRDVAIILKCMAQIYHERDEFEQALALYKQALAAAKTSLGVHAETASIYNKLGNLFYEHQDFDNAIDMYEQGLEVERSVLHSLHPNIVVTLSNLGQVRFEPTGV
jgi:tetratricopeptide (TPR) repeat protein